MSKTVLVTGAAGFIGFHICQVLLERGDTVIGVDNFNDYYDQKLKEDRNDLLERFRTYKLYRADTRNKEIINQIFEKEKIDVVCHLAAQAGVRYSVEHPGEYVQTNIEGTVNIFEAARKFDVKDIVAASSSSVYGNNPVPWSEKQDVNKPINPYGATKRATEILAYTYHHLYDLNITMLRYFTVYGPWGRPDMAYFKFANKITNNEPIELNNYGKMKRDFTYIDDVVDGTIKVIDNPKQYEIYNIGNHKSEELGYFVELIEKNLGKEAQKNLVPAPPGEFLENFADIEKAQKDLGFEPKISIEEGLKKFVDWYKEYYKIA